MHLDLTEEETAALLKELDGLIDGSLLPLVADHDVESDPRQAPTRAAATTAQAVRATAGDSAGAAV